MILAVSPALGADGMVTGLDLPLKALARQDAGGQTWLA
jgi:hypothetical protein